MKINGLESKDSVWLSMLFVAPQFHRQGIGEFAVKYAESFVAKKGFRKLAIQTTNDNIPAQSLYKKCGYSEVRKTDKIVFVKAL